MWTRWAPAAALVFGVMNGQPAGAEEPLAPGVMPPVEYTVSVGVASAEKGAIDERFSAVPRRVGSMRFGSIQLWKEQALRLQFGEWGRMVLPTGAEISLLPVGVRGSALSMKLELPGVVNTRVRLQNHSPLMVGPLPHGDGYLLIRIEPEFTDYLVAEPAKGSTPPPSSVPVNQGR